MLKHTKQAFDTKPIVAIVILTDGVRFVIVCNPEKINRGWVFPGGHVQCEESAIDEVIPHVFEETSIELNPSSFELLLRRRRARTHFLSFEVVVEPNVLDGIPSKAPSGHDIRIVDKKRLMKMVAPPRVSMMQYQPQ